MDIETKLAKTDHEIHDYLAARWSPRMFADTEITDDQIMRLFEAARWAPSSYNQQPWRFFYSRKGGKNYDRMFDCLSDFNQSWVGNAPILIFAGYQKNWDDGRDNFHALHDLGLAAANLTFQAQSMGIAVHQMAGVNWKEVHKEFSVPEGFHVATAIAVGYYGGPTEELGEDLEEQERAERSRKPLKEILAEGEWPGE